MNSKILDSVSKTQTFPCLMEYYGDGNFIVLFANPTKGTVVHAEENSPHEVGFVSSTWEISMFEPFDKIIQLSNWDVKVVK